MQAIRPSRKRAGTSTNATPQTNARRMRIDDVLCTNAQQADPTSQVNDLTRHSAISVITSVATSPYCHMAQAEEYITPPTPCSSPEPRHGEAILDRLFPTKNRMARPGHDCSSDRNGFSLPLQTDSSQLRNKRLELAIPVEPAEYDIQFPVHDPQEPDVSPRRTPPRSNPSIHACSFSLPPSTNYGLCTPTSAGPSSGPPSFCSFNPCSPLSTQTPATPRSRFNSAASTLKVLLMADQLGMSPKELEELNDFANVPMSGSSKRAGRVLVHKDVEQRKTGNVKHTKTDVGQNPYHGRRDCQMGNCTRHSGPDMWKEVDWSRFSDASDDEMPDTGMDCDSDEEMSAMEGCVRMATDADAEYASADETTPTKRVQYGTARVSKMTRPAELHMKSSSRKVIAEIGPLGERESCHRTSEYSARNKRQAS